LTDRLQRARYSPEATAPAYWPGTSGLAAVVIENASSEASGVLAKNDWIKLHRPGSRKISQALVSHGKQLFDESELVMPDGGESKVYFDVTASFGKY
jgi:hypothetical protein